MSYWENRRAKEMYEAMESAETTAKEIRDIYAKASRELNFQIAEIYERYQNKFGISEAEALMLLNQDITPDRIKELSEKLAELKGLEANEVLKELESPAYRKRIERLQQLQTNIDKMMRDVYKQEKLVSTDHYVEQYGNSYYHEVFDIMNATGLDYSFSYVDPKELNHIMNSNWSGANYSQRIWGNTQGLAEELKTQLSLAYLTGKSEKDIAMELANKYSTSAAKARRLVRTESAYISNQAIAAADEDAGIDKYRICAVLDLKTSEICRSLDGEEYEYDKMEVGVNYPPFHPYCRTTVLSILDDDCMEGLTRRARDPVTGEVKKFPASMTYKEWYEKEVAHNPEALKSEKIEKNRGSDLKQYERYKEVIGKRGDLKNIDSFRETKYNNPEEWEYTKGLYKYLNKYPSSNENIYKVGYKLNKNGIDRGTPLPAEKKNAYILPNGKRDSYHVMHRMIERNITDDDMRKIIDSAKVMFSQWGGKRLLYASDDGMAVVHNIDDKWIFKTAWKKADFDEVSDLITEVIKEYVK